MPLDERRAPCQRPFVLEAQRIIDLFARRCGVELDAAHAAPAQVFDAPFQQSPSDAAPPISRVDKHHADPGQARRVNGGRGRPRRRAVPFGKETAFGLAGEQTLPVLDRLVPAGQGAHGVREWQVSRRHQAQAQVHFIERGESVLQNLGTHKARL